jgi:hypothetical protein
MMKATGPAAGLLKMHITHLLISGVLTIAAVLADLPDSWADDPGKVMELSATDRQELDALLGPGVVGEALPAKPLLKPADYMVKDKSQLSYRTHERNGKTWTEMHDFAAATPAETGGLAGWEYRVGKLHRSIFALQADGSLATIREFDGDKKVMSTFTPGEPLVIPGLQPGQSRDTAIKVTVADIDDPSDISYQGQLDVSYVYLGHFRIKVPAGSYDADLIKWTYQGKIGPAHIKTSQYRFLAAKSAMIAMIELRNISAMLVYHDDTRQGKLLLTSGQP